MEFQDTRCSRHRGLEIGDGMTAPKIPSDLGTFHS